MASLCALQSTCSVIVAGGPPWRRSVRRSSGGARNRARQRAQTPPHIRSAGCWLPWRDRPLVRGIPDAELISARRSAAEGAVAGTSGDRMDTVQSGGRLYRDWCASRSDAELGRRAAAGIDSARCRWFAPLSCEPGKRRVVSRLTSAAAVEQGALPEFIKSRPQVQ